MPQEKANEILAKFKKAKSRRQHKDALWKELDAFDRNEQWELDTKLPPWIPKPVTNFIHLVKYTKRAALAMENPSGKLRPTHIDSIEAIDKLNKAYEFTMDKIKARKVIRQNIEDAKLLGAGFAQVYWDEYKEGRLGTTVLGSEGAYYEGEIGLRVLDISTVYPDPTAFTIEDCQHIFVRERKPLDWIKNHPKFGKGVDEDTMGKNSPEERGEIYNRDYETDQDGLVDFTHYYAKKANDAGGFTYSCTYLVGEKVVHHIEPLRPNRYPFAMLQDFPQRQDFWPMSTCQMVLDNQKIINKLESILAMISTLMQNPQKVVSKESGVNPVEVSRYGNAAGHTYTANGDPSKAIYYVPPAQIPVALINLVENAKQNIREVTGLTEAYMGQTVGSLQTSSGVDSLIERATMRDRDQMYDIEQYIEQLSSIVIDFMTEYYEQPRMIRISGANPEEFTFDTFVGAEYRDIDYDFFIDVSAKAPITRMREAQEAKELLNMQGQYQFEVPVIKPQEMMKLSNYSMADQLIQRMNQDELTNKTEQAMQVATMMVEALENQMPPEEVLQMGSTMFEQLSEQGGQAMGNTANNFQARQQGAGL